MVPAATCSYMQGKGKTSWGGANDLSTMWSHARDSWTDTPADTFLRSGRAGHARTFRSKPHPSVTAQNVSRLCQIFPGRQNPLQLRAIILWESKGQSFPKAIRFPLEQQKSRGKMGKSSLALVMGVHRYLLESSFRMDLQRNSLKRRTTKGKLPADSQKPWFGTSTSPCKNRLLSPWASKGRSEM